VVKQINIFLDDEEHERVKEVKGDMTWVEFFMLSAELIKKNKMQKVQK